MTLFTVSIVALKPFDSLFLFVFCLKNITLRHYAYQNQDVFEHAPKYSGLDILYSLLIGALQIEFQEVVDG